MCRFRTKRFLTALGAVALGAATCFAPLGASAGAGGCPDLSGKVKSFTVGATFTDDGSGTATYLFSSANWSPSGGIPGLIEYFVYTSQSPDTATATVLGANGSAWGSGISTGCFSYQRPDGDPSNVPLNGALDVQIGTAFWSGGVPAAADQTILLHINNPDECQALYGSGVLTCFVLPGLGEEEEGGSTSAIATEVHLGATDNGTPIIVDSDGIESCHVQAGAYVHDSADCTFTPPVPAPTGSTITFSFYGNDACTGTPVATTSFDVSGQVDPFIDPALAQGPMTPGAYGYQAIFTSGDQTVVKDSVSKCEPFHVYTAALTPGYWKNHLEPISSTCPKTKPGCSANGPWAIGDLPQYLGQGPLGPYLVDTTAKVTLVFNGMNCSVSSDQNAVGCLAGHLLATKLNLANGADPCISVQGTVAAADQFLVGVSYIGPTGTYALTAAQRATAISLKTALDNYNNGLGCQCH